tara:strand:- start:67 stop:237 length:171 start_codon:yes stop_codon:yes gene_type:complete
MVNRDKVHAYYMVKQVYKDLIRAKESKGEDASVLRDRLTEINNEKWNRILEQKSPS